MKFLDFASQKVSKNQIKGVQTYKLGRH